MGRFEDLVTQLASEDPAIVARAAHALGDLGDPRAVPLLIDLLQSTERHGLKNAAAVGLRELANPDALQPLIKEIRDPRNANHLGTLLWALETMDARAAIVDLAQIICQNEYEAALMATSAIHGLNTPINPENRDDAMEVLLECANSSGIEEWRSEMLSDTLEFLERYETVV